MFTRIPDFLKIVMNSCENPDFKKVQKYLYSEGIIFYAKK